MVEWQNGVFDRDTFVIPRSEMYALEFQRSHSKTCQFLKFHELPLQNYTIRHQSLPASIQRVIQYKKY